MCGRVLAYRNEMCKSMILHGSARRKKSPGKVFRSNIESRDAERESILKSPHRHWSLAVPSDYSHTPYAITSET